MHNKRRRAATHPQQQAQAAGPFAGLGIVPEDGICNFGDRPQPFHRHFRVHAILHHIVQQLSIVVQLPPSFCPRQSRQLCFQLL